jgi:enoyl-CoA hydratase/carnithine racemase
VVANEHLVDEAYSLAGKLLAQPHAARGRAKKALNIASTLPLAEAMELETAVTTQGMLDPEATARAIAALGGKK